mmetsp:Transcript_11619/g.13388  ORF Transcript_11619/g.13388 Transcript_11619/m.13388 type:complete len:764 (+) Transcript_11619:18-2309(+)
MDCASDFAYLKRKVAFKPSLEALSKNVINPIVNIEAEDDVDTNVISLNFKALPTAMQNLSFGDPYFCQKCKITLSTLSLENIHSKDKYLTLFSNKSLDIIAEEDNQKAQEEEKADMKDESLENKGKRSVFKAEDLKSHESVWVCEFCQAHNKISLEPEEMPKTNDMFYVLQSANQQQMMTETPDSTDQEISVIFCIDYSGSMCVTSEIKLKDELKHGLSAEEYEMLKGFIEDGASQYLPNQKQGTQWVSRKQCVLAAIENQLDEIKKAHPNRKVGVVAFNNEVILYGDGSKDPIIIAGDKLNKKDVCVNTGAESYISHLSQPISESGTKLLDKLYSLKENGKTALGPAIALSLGLASKGKPGSTVIICTDGLANIGVGELDSTKSYTDNFYEDMGIYAKERGIMVNVITIKGEGCKMEKLGQIADLTQGKVTRVNPDNITNDFKNIMKEEVVGTQVDVKIRLHPSLKFRSEEDVYLSENKSVYNKNIGNVTASTTLTFEYQLKNDVELQQEGVNLDALKEVPLQATITYISTQGHKLLRIVTKKQLATEDKNQAEKNVKINLLAARVTQKTSHLANLGDLQKAQDVNLKWDKYLSEDVASNNMESSTFQRGYGNYKSKNAQLQTHMNNRMNRREMRSEKVDYAEGEKKSGGKVMNFIKSGLNLFSKKKDESKEIQEQPKARALSPMSFGMGGGMNASPSYNSNVSLSNNSNAFMAQQQQMQYQPQQMQPMQKNSVEIEEDMGSSDEEDANFYQFKQAKCEDFD